MASALSLSSLLALVISRSNISFQGLFPYVCLMGATIGGLLYLGLDSLLKDERSVGRYRGEDLRLPIDEGDEEILMNRAGHLADAQCSVHGRPLIQNLWKMIILRSLKVGIPLLSALEAYLLLAFTLGSFMPLFVIPSNSMSPTLNMGDIVIVVGVNPASLKVGDIIIFDVPSPYNRYTPSPVIHRVVDVRVEDGRLYFKTKGDNLPSMDPWSLPAEGVIGIYAFKISYLGIPLMFLKTSIGLALSAVLLLLWIFYPFIKGGH